MSGLYLFGALAQPGGGDGPTAALADALSATADAPLITPLEVLFVFLGGVVLYLFVRVVRWGFPLVPMAPERRDRLARVAPLAEVVLWMVYLVSVIAWTLQGFPMARLVALALLVVALVLAIWFLVRDYLSGVVLRTERWVRVGDVIRIGEVEGEVRRFGARQVELVQAHGDRVFLPYRAVREATVVLRRTRRDAVRHTFEVAIPASVAPTAARSAVRRAALLSHWISPSHEPTIVARDARTLEVTLHALTDIHASDVEAHVRAAVEGLTGPSADVGPRDHT